MPGTENKTEDSCARGAGPHVGRHNAMSAGVNGCPRHVGSLSGVGCTCEGDPQRQKTLDHGHVCLSGNQSMKLFFPVQNKSPRRGDMWRGTRWGSRVRIKELVVNVSRRDRYNECPTETYLSLQIKLCLLVIHRFF